MRIIAVVNQKGGCGKTTTAINLAAVYAARGLRTLLVDVDPQAHCAAGLGVPEKRVEYSIGDAMLADLSEPVDAPRLMWEVARNLDLAPSTMRMAGLEAPEGGLHELPDRDRRLQRVLQGLARHYDRCLIDCPPHIGLLTFNALRAAREALIPVETGYFSLRGAERQWQTIQRVIKRIGRPIACHILPTIHHPDSELARDILAALRRQFAGQIIPGEIGEHAELREAASLGQAVIEYAPESRARWDHEALADWLDEHPARPVVEIETFDRSAQPGVYADGAQPSASRRLSSADHPPRGAEPLRGAGAPSGGSSAGARVAELVERLRERAHQAAAMEPVPVQELAVPAVTRSDAAARAASQELTRSVPDARRSVLPGVGAAATAGGETPGAPAPWFGVRYTAAGVLFRQPDQQEPIFVAGDFNGWSTNATLLLRDPARGVREALLPLAPGRHVYRLVIAGQWREDPYNDEREPNEFGEYNSMLDVPDAPASSGSP